MTFSPTGRRQERWVGVVSLPKLMVSPLRRTINFAAFNISAQ
jgi:hypothetical protein